MIINGKFVKYEVKSCRGLFKVLFCYLLLYIEETYVGTQDSWRPVGIWTMYLQNWLPICYIYTSLGTYNKISVLIWKYLYLKLFKLLSSKYVDVSNSSCCVLDHSYEVWNESVGLVFGIIVWFEFLEVNIQFYYRHMKRKYSLLPPRLNGQVF